MTGEGYGLSGAISGAAEARQATASSAPVDFQPLMTAVVNCNDSRLTDGKVIGDPMEAALLVLAHKARAPQAYAALAWPRVAEIPFDSLHKFMATFHRNNAQDAVQVFIKGAPDVLLGLCSQELTSNGLRVLAAGGHQNLHARYEAFGAQGLRGLLIASRTIAADEFDPLADLMPWMTELTFVGLVGLMDPARAEAKTAIAQCAEAGIDVKMITGDHQVTALAIARELGLKGQAITGAAFDKLSETELPAAIDKVSVFARVTPSHKVAIVRALQKNGHVVAMTGDGVNDAPALKCADIGVAMGSGTAVAKAAATMVLTNDNFATLVSAVRQGRTLYDNIVKFVRFSAVDHHRRDFDHIACAVVGLARSLHGGANSMDCHHHGWPTCCVTCSRCCAPRHHARAAAQPHRTAADAGADCKSSRLRLDHDSGNARRYVLRQSKRYGNASPDAGLHHLCVVSVF